MTLVEIRQASERLGNQVRSRNRREMVAAFVVVAVFAAFLFVFDDPLMRLGSAMTIAATAFVVWQMLRRTSRDDPAQLGEDVRTHYRARLMRERDMLVSVPRWYLLPFVPGYALFTLGKLTDGAEPTVLWLAVNVGVPLAIFGGVWWLNLRAARTLQRQLDAS